MIEGNQYLVNICFNTLALAYQFWVYRSHNGVILEVIYISVAHA